MAPPAVSTVPAVMPRLPVKVLAALEIVTVPVPDLIRLPAPAPTPLEITPERVTFESKVTVREALPRLRPPEKLSVLQ